jgi:hypothetical protein
MNTEIPPSIQTLFWSTPNLKHDLKKDAPEIIHKVLAFGNLTDLFWLKNTYDLSTIQRIFQEKPMAVYTPSSFNFASSVVLHIDKNTLKKIQYVRSVY